MKKLLLHSAVLFALNGYAQQNPDTAKCRNNNLNIFLDCGYCDMDYLRTEVTFVNYVRDRMEAQVDIIASSLSTGSGGTEYTFVFKGQKEFAGKSDTLKYDVSSFVTQDVMRKGIAQTLKVGLMRYIANGPLVGKINITYACDTIKSVATPTADIWKSWVFSIGGNGFVNAQQLTDYEALSGSISASKVTPDWKISLSANVSYNTSMYIITADSIVKSETRSQSLNGQYVKSINEHFSWGLGGMFNSSTFNNIESEERITPGFEYSVFPYSQATHRMLRFMYNIYADNSVYYDTTIYGKTKTQLLGESMTASLTYKEPWGSVSTSVVGSHYFYDFSKNNLAFSAAINLSLFEGFTLSLFGSASLVHDQVFLPATGATPDEILLQVRALATSYYYFTSLGISYTFGSIYNNVVNPRFTSGNGF